MYPHERFPDSGMNGPLIEQSTPTVVDGSVSLIRRREAPQTTPEPQGTEQCEPSQKSEDAQEGVSASRAADVFGRTWVPDAQVEQYNDSDDSERNGDQRPEPAHDANRRGLLGHVSGMRDIPCR